MKSQRRQQTEDKLLQAVEALILKEGAGALGVNAIAREAGVDKVLIYRYFGNLEGLYRAYGEQANFWPTVEEMLGPEENLELPPAQLYAKILGNFARGLQRRPHTLELLAWECSHRDQLTTALEDVRQRRGQELGLYLAQRGFPATPDFLKATAILAASLNYLSIRRRDVQYFASLDIRQEALWEELPDLLAKMIEPLLEPPRPRG